jgi:hypothetical protein
LKAVLKAGVFMFQTVVHKTVLLDLAVVWSHVQCNTSIADISVTKTVTEVYVFVNRIIQYITECEPMDYSKWYSKKLSDSAIPSESFGTNIAALPVAHSLFHNSCTFTQCTIFNSPIFLQIFNTVNHA